MTFQEMYFNLGKCNANLILIYGKIHNLGQAQEYSYTPLNLSHLASRSPSSFYTYAATTNFLPFLPSTMLSEGHAKYKYIWSECHLMFCSD